MFKEQPPPWIRYAGEEPWWSGWRQGESEAWLRDTWLPFWRGLDAQARSAYMREWPPPSADWELYLTKYWP